MGQQDEPSQYASRRCRAAQSQPTQATRPQTVSDRSSKATERKVTQRPSNHKHARAWTERRAPLAKKAEGDPPSKQATRLTG